MSNPFSKLGNWLADRTGIHPTHAAHELGGVLDNGWTKAALAAALFGTGAGAPLGAAIMGAAGATGGALKEGGGLRDAFTGGLKGAGYGAAAGGAGGALRSAFAPSSSAAGASFGAGPADSGAGLLPGLGEAAPSASRGFSLGNTAKSIASFAKENPNAVGQGLQGLGSLATSGAQNDQRRAETDKLNQESAASQYALEQQKRRDASLEPLRRLLGQQMQQFQQPGRIAPNPYG